MDRSSRSDAGKNSFAMRKVTVAFAIAATLSACASPGTPPGAPERHIAPQVVSITPDTNATNVKARDVVVKFDAVVSERPAATNATELHDLVTVSPRRGDIDVDWKRSSIAIRPKRGWLPNTTYTVSIAPGISDLQGNVRKDPVTIIFSTGDSIAQSFVRGVVFDWMTGMPAPGAIVEVVPRPDSAAVYVAVADSAGRFEIRAPNAEHYTVRASINTLKERVFDSRMAFDTLSVALRDSARVELLTYARDSVGPQLGIVRIDDSVTLRAMFTGAIDPITLPALTQFSLLASDSSRIPIASAVPITLFQEAADSAMRDSLKNNAEANAPTAAVVDTAARNKPSKPLLFREIVLKLAQPLTQKSEYVLKVSDIRSPSGVAASSERKFTAPEVKKVEPKVEAKQEPKPDTTPKDEP